MRGPKNQVVSTCNPWPTIQNQLRPLLLRLYNSQNTVLNYSHGIHIAKMQSYIVNPNQAVGNHHQNQCVMCYSCHTVGRHGECCCVIAVCTHGWLMIESCDHQHGPPTSPYTATWEGFQGGYLGHVVNTQRLHTYNGEPCKSVSKTVTSGLIPADYCQCVLGQYLSKTYLCIS